MTTLSRNTYGQVGWTQGGKALADASGQVNYAEAAG
jgi:hypothetical protein